jgi:hypothetical protein
MKTRDDSFTEDSESNPKFKYAILMAYGLSMCVCVVLGSLIYLVYRLS